MKNDGQNKLLRSTGKNDGKRIVFTPLSRVKSRCLSLIVLLSLAGCGVSDGFQYPVMKSDLIVKNVNTRLLLPNFQWLDNNRLIVVAFDHYAQRAGNNTYSMESLVLWDTATNTITKIAEPDVGGLCLKGDQIRYFRRETDPEGRIPRETQRREHFLGPLGKGERVVYQEPTDLMTCDSEKTEGGLPEWTNNIPYPKINVRRLRPEHGFIVIDRESPRHWPRSIKLYQNENDTPIDLHQLLDGSGPKPSTLGLDPKWYAHKMAYYIPSLRGSSSWWLLPSGKLEVAFDYPAGGINFPSHAMSMTEIGMAKTAPVVGTAEYDVETIGAGGLYMLSDFNRPKRIVKGRIGQELEISPDGCKVAFANDDRSRIDSRKPYSIHKLQVINLCSEKTQ